MMRMPRHHGWTLACGMLPLLLGVSCGAPTAAGEADAPLAGGTAGQDSSAIAAPSRGSGGSASRTTGASGSAKGGQTVVDTTPIEGGTASSAQSEPGGNTDSGGNTSSAGSTGLGTVTAAGGTTTSTTPAGSGGTGSAGTATTIAGAGGTPVTTGPDAPYLPGLPSQSLVLEAMRRANDFFVARWPDPSLDIVSPDKTRPSNLWTRAIYFEGLMSLFAIEPDAVKRAAYYDYAVAWGSSKSHPWALTYTAPSVPTNNADNQACGQTYLDLYRIENVPERIATLKASIDDMVAKNTVNVWTWIDAIQMAMPVFAKLGVITKNTAYFDAMWGLYEYARNQRGGGLFNTLEGLWWRDFHFTPSGGTLELMSATRHSAMPSSNTDAYIKAPNGKNLYWSRGNGWVLAALVRVLDELPANDPHRATYEADFLAMAHALLPLQRSDGFWPESLLDPNHCSSIGIAGEDAPETSGTALFVYGLAWGIRSKLLDPNTFGSAVQAGWNGLLTTALQSDGLVGYVQSTGDRPCTGPSPLGPRALANFDDYGVGCLLLAGSEIWKLAPKP